MNVFGHPATDVVVDETWPYSPAGGHYGRSKMRMEQWCLETAQHLGKTRLVVLNPSCVFGPEGKTYTQLPLELAKKSQFAWVDDGRGIANYIFIDNLVDAMLWVASCPNAHGERYLVTDGFCSWRQFLEPLLGHHAEDLPSYQAAKFASFDRLDRNKLPDVFKSLMGNAELRKWVRDRKWMNSIKQIARPLAKDKSATVVATNHADQPHMYPPSWLPELFGPTVTRFSNSKLRGIGWQPSVGLAEAHLRTKKWLAEIGQLSS